MSTLVIWLIAFRRFPRGHATRSAAGWCFFFMTTEALVGAGLVLFRMVADNPSTARAAWMAAHLINTFLLLGSLAWLTVSAHQTEGTRFPRDRQSRWLFGGAAAVILLAGVSGAVAALGDTLFPASDFTQGLREDLSSSSHLFLRLRVWHPVIAVLGSGYLLWLAALLLRRWSAASIRGLPVALGTLVLLQIGIGLLNVALLAPVWLQLLHLLVADATWITLALLALSSPSPIPGASLVS